LDFSDLRTTQGCSNVFASGDRTNTRVNQDCSLRRQAEEALAINPTNPDNLIAGQNDSRIGFNRCGYDFSMDGGKTWGDMLPPFYQFVNLDGVTFDACSDPTETFDAQGNAYVGGVLFELNFADSAFVVAKSNAGINGAFYHTPAPLSFQEYQDVPLGVVANDNDPNIFNDKEFIVADSQRRSIKQNNVYATWTRFAVTGVGVGANGPITFSQSTDGGATWSAGIEISGANAAACTVFSGEANPNACDQDQGSHPIVGPDGTVYVAFGNGNTPTVGVNQHMIVSCAPANDCSKSVSWTAPVKITDDFGTQPFGPVASTACAGGRQCLPPNGYRLDDFVEGSLSVDNSGNLYFVWADFRNGAPNCNPNGAAATATTPCDNDVFYSYSTNGGASFTRILPSPFATGHGTNYGDRTTPLLGTASVLNTLTDDPLPVLGAPPAFVAIATAVDELEKRRVGHIASPGGGHVARASHYVSGDADKSNLCTDQRAAGRGSNAIAKHDDDGRLARAALWNEHGHAGTALHPDRQGCVADGDQRANRGAPNCVSDVSRQECRER
jgi:hypothetical protein